jgi:hypothetical protein
VINEYKTSLFEKVNIYPSIRRVFLSMQNQLEIGCLLDTFIFSCIMRRLLSMQIQIQYTWLTAFNICGWSHTSIVVNNNWCRRIFQRSQTWFWNRMKAKNTRIQDQVIRKGKNISKYPPCVFVYAKSVGSWMPLGHIHIQLYNETCIVHAN